MQREIFQIYSCASDSRSNFLADFLMQPILVQKSAEISKINNLIKDEPEFSAKKILAYSVLLELRT